MKVFFLFLAILFCSLHSQEMEVYFNQAAEEYFLLGLRQYAQKDFAPALQSFQQSVRSFPMNHRVTAATIMAAKTQYALKNYTDAAALCDSFLFLFPASDYAEDALFTRGMCYYNLRMYARSMGEMLRVAVLAEQRRNQEHSLKMIEHVSLEFLSEEELDSISRAAEDGSIKRLMQIILAERLFSTGKFGEAKNILESIKTDSTDAPIELRAKGLYERIQRGNIVRVCALLPLLTKSAGGARDKRIANEVLEGIQLALAEYEAKMEPGQVTVELRVQDSQRSPAVIDSIVYLLKSDSTVAAIIGPIFSDETIAAAVSAQREGIPLISPTATDDSIALTGPIIFQTNSPTSMRGKILAQYAVKVAGAKKVAILASDAPFSKIQADSFAAEIQRLGGEIVIDRRYKRGAPDLREHFKAIRIAAANLAPEYHVIFRGKINTAYVTTKMMAYGFKISTIDSILSKSDTLNLTAFIGDKAKELADSLNLPYRKVLPFVDSLHYPVSSIDVLFSPISTSEQIGVITSQIALYNIKATVLGTSEWYNMTELDMNRRYADGVIFGSDRWIEQTERKKRVFTQYTKQYGKQISDNVLFGYDVMSLVLKQFMDGVLTREQLVMALSGVVAFSGVKSSITLTTGRVNGDLSILRYKDGMIKKLQTYTYQP